MFHPVLKFYHNSKLVDTESNWESVSKTKLPQATFADQGNPEKKDTWEYPHHWIQKGGDLSSEGLFTSGTMYLHKGGLIAAIAAANGSGNGQHASAKVKSHLEAHQKELGLDKSDLVYLDLKSEDEEDQVAYAEVYAPNHIDTDNETMDKKAVEQMAWEFLSSGKINKIDIQHDFQESGCHVVESFLARKDWAPFIEGAWVLGVWCPDDVWEQVKSGKLNGFSFAGSTEKYPATVLVEVAKQIAGVTEKSTSDVIPFHDHTFIINFDNKGQIVSGKTDVVSAHSHLITMGTATQTELEHSHRLILE